MCQVKCQADLIVLAVCMLVAITDTNLPKTIAQATEITVLPLLVLEHPASQCEQDARPTEHACLLRSENQTMMKS